MHQIDSPSAVPAMPAPLAAGTPGYFAHGSPGGAPYTILTSDWANALQMEICNVITGAGITLSKTNQSQLLAAIQSIADDAASGAGPGTGSRIKLTAPLDMYVATSGNDTNNGLTPGTPFRTLQKPIDVIYANYDLAGQNVVVHVGNGTYTAGVLHSRPINGVISYVGNVTTPTSCKVALAVSGSCFASLYGAILTVSGFAVESTATESGVPYWATRGMGLMASYHGTILFDRIAFGPITYAHISTGVASYIGTSNSTATYSIYGSAQGHLVAGYGASTIGISTAAVTITNTPAFTWFVWASNGVVIAPAVTFSGTATGQRYLVDNGGYVVTAGGGPNYFPGNSAGSATTGYYT